VERGRRRAALKGSGSGSGDDSNNSNDGEDQRETAAERRRREAALGMTPHADVGEDSDDDDTPRVPPSRKSIRFADAVERGRQE
jgi:hypothetical protein